MKERGLVLRRLCREITGLRRTGLSAERLKLRRENGGRGGQSAGAGARGSKAKGGTGASKDQSRLNKLEKKISRSRDRCEIQIKSVEDLYAKRDG